MTPPLSRSDRPPQDGEKPANGGASLLSADRPRGARAAELLAAFEADMAAIAERSAAKRRAGDAAVVMTDLDKIAALAAHDALPRARVVVPWWTRLLLWFVDPPPVRALALPAGTPEAASPPPAVPPDLEEIVITMRRLRGDPVDPEAVRAVAKRLRLAGVTPDAIAAALERFTTPWPP